MNGSKARASRIESRGDGRLANSIRHGLDTVCMNRQERPKASMQSTATGKSERENTSSTVVMNVRMGASLAIVMPSNVQYSTVQYSRVGTVEAMAAP